MAKLQHRIWQASCSVESLQQNSSEVVYYQSDWDATCEALLAPGAGKSKRGIMGAHKHSSEEKGTNDSIRPSHLWSKVFRGPFMVQVERLLQVIGKCYVEYSWIGISASQDHPNLLKYLHGYSATTLHSSKLLTLVAVHLL